MISLNWHINISHTHTHTHTHTQTQECTLWYIFLNGMNTHTRSCKPVAYTRCIYSWGSCWIESIFLCKLKVQKRWCFFPSFFSGRCGRPRTDRPFSGSSPGQTDLSPAPAPDRPTCARALYPGTIMRTGNYHFTASSIGGIRRLHSGGEEEEEGGDSDVWHGAENSRARRKEGKHDGNKTKGRWLLCVCFFLFSFLSFTPLGEAEQRDQLAADNRTGPDRRN